MWQTLAILFVLAGVLIYVIHHYIGIFRGESAGCSCCSGCSGPQGPADGESCGHAGQDSCGDGQTGAGLPKSP
ncbi:MAG: hypothetical protein ABFD98_07145 [Syntrophobacteraceae bacterium]|nr:hypothetical protein [Desulfobacteraceae bacterium]